MSDLIGDLNRTLAVEHRVEVEFELRYLERDPPASAFAYDTLYLDREVRRAARELLEGVPSGPLEDRRRHRPLEIKRGLVVGESHRSDFSFLLHAPPDLYEIILSDPVEFLTRVIALSAGYGMARELFMRLRRGGRDEGRQPLDDPAERESGKFKRTDDAAAGGTVERIYRLRFPSGVEYEAVELIPRE